jgi:hypothetical protein
MNLRNSPEENPDLNSRQDLKLRAEELADRIKCYWKDSGRSAFYDLMGLSAYLPKPFEDILG